MTYLERNAKEFLTIKSKFDVTTKQTAFCNENFEFCNELHTTYNLSVSKSNLNYYFLSGTSVYIEKLNLNILIERLGIVNIKSSIYPCK